VQNAGKIIDCTSQATCWRKHANFSRSLPNCGNY